MLKRKIVVISSAIVFLSGCATTIYTYRGAKYSSSEAALKAQHDDIDRMVAEINPTDNPLGGKALIVLPSRRLIEKKGIKFTGPTSNIKREGVEYIITASELSGEAMAEALTRRKIFEEVMVRKSDQPEQSVLPDCDVIIYLKLLAPDQAQWFLRASSNDKSVPIYADQSLPDGAQRTLSWLDYIEKTAEAQLRR